MIGVEGRTFVPRAEIGVEPLTLRGNNEAVIFHGLEFTQRRIDILTLTAQGFSKEQTAKELSLHIGTIGSEMRKIKKAFGEPNMFWPVIETARAGIIDIPKPTISMDKPTQEKLSNREYETLDSLTNGRDIEETASFLNVTPFTVDARLRSAREKLGLKKNPQKGLDNLELVLLYLDAKKSGTLLPAEYQSLSQKKRQIYKLILSGHSTRQMSEMLNAKIKTIDSFKYQILESLNASGLAEFLIKLADRKLVDPHKYIEDVKKLNNDLLTNVDPENISSLLSKMTKKELDVLNAFVTSSKKGGQNKEIGESLDIGKTTVEARINSILRKLGGAKREHVVMWYLAATAPPASQVFDPEASDRRRETLQR